MTAYSRAADARDSLEPLLDCEASDNLASTIMDLVAEAYEPMEAEPNERLIAIAWRADDQADDLLEMFETVMRHFRPQDIASRIVFEDAQRMLDRIP